MSIRQPGSDAPVWCRWLLRLRHQPHGPRHPQFGSEPAFRFVLQSLPMILRICAIRSNSVGTETDCSSTSAPPVSQTFNTAHLSHRCHPTDDTGCLVGSDPNYGLFLFKRDNLVHNIRDYSDSPTWIHPYRAQKPDIKMIYLSISISIC